MRRPSDVIAGAALFLCCSGCTERPPSSPAPAAAPPSASASATAEPLVVSRQELLDFGCRLLDEFDSDGDARLTVLDASAGASWPRALAGFGGTVELADLGEASRLMQEIFWRLREDPAPRLAIELGRARESAADFLLRQLNERHVRGLTRTITTDDSLLALLRDEKLGTTGERPVDWCRTERAAPEPPAATTDAATSAAATDAATKDPFLYVPETEPNTLRRFQAFADQLASQGRPSFQVRPVPAHVEPSWVEARTRQGEHGLLMLEPDRPFVVPGGRFNEMYGWDSFFITWGLVTSGQRELARAMVDQQRYQIEHYGKILNANRTYYLLRSQPPFFTQLVELAWEASTDIDRGAPEWVVWFARQAAAAVREYETVWTREPHATALCAQGTCLARYRGLGRGQPPEVEPGHFDWVYQRVARARGQCRFGPGKEAQFVACARELGARYRAGKLRSKELDAFFVHDRAMRESGHDTTYRWFDAELLDRTADFATVDLNVLLLRYELDLASWFARGWAGDARSLVWCERARRRAGLLQKYLWDAERGLYLDYDVARGRRHDYVSATTLYPLWIEPQNVCGVELTRAADAPRLVEGALRLLERPGGLAATARSSLENAAKATVLALRDSTAEERVVDRQWDHPNGWAPHQMLAWAGLRKQGFEREATRLSYAWLYTIVRNAADHHGTVPEKFDVESRSHRVFAEYGNVNTDFAYITEEGFGWMNASFVVGWAGLDEEHRDALRRLATPETVFPQR